MSCAVLPLAGYGVCCRVCLFGVRFRVWRVGLRVGCVGCGDKILGFGVWKMLEIMTHFFTLVTPNPQPLYM